MTDSVSLRTVCAALATIVGSVLVAACASSPAPGTPARLPTIGPAGPWQGDRLMEDMITERVAGRTLYGCYPDGAPWAERLNRDGTFQDMAADGRILGEWYVTPLDEICYRYTAGPNADQPPYCYVLTETGDGLHFYDAGTDMYAASTACPMPARNQWAPRQTVR